MAFHYCMQKKIEIKFNVCCVSVFQKYYYILYTYRAARPAQCWLAFSNSMYWSSNILYALPYNHNYKIFVNEPNTAQHGFIKHMVIILNWIIVLPFSSWVNPAGIHSSVPFPLKPSLQTHAGVWSVALHSE